jgi:RNA polymerase sigma factor (sigma-70 family)
MHKLYLIERYLMAEQKLRTENDGITPNQEEIMNELNKQIKAENQERNRLKKEGFFDKPKPLFERYFDFYTEYKKTYDVNPFIDPETYKWDGFISKKAERDEIEYSYDENVDYLDYMISCIEDDFEDNDKIVLFLHTNKAGKTIYDTENWSIYDENDKYYSKIEVLPKKEALEKLKVYRVILTSSMEDYVKVELERRSDEVNNRLKESNAPIVEENRKIAKLRDKYELGKKLQRHLTINQVQATNHDIELLFGNDDEFMMLLNNSIFGNKNRYHRHYSLSTEDEALNNHFMNDYYSAIEELSVTEKYIMVNYFDENGVHSKTAKEIGAELGLSESQVYKQKTKALQKLRANPTMIGYYII